MCCVFTQTVEPPGGVTIPNTFARAATIRLTASPTAGATYEATFTTNTAGIPPLTVTFANTLFQASGLIPDIDYTVSVVAVSGGERSTAVTTTATTQPASEQQVHMLRLYLVPF